MANRKKKIRILSVRLTTTDEFLLARLARLAGCKRSELIVDMIHTSARAMGLLEPLAPVSEVPRG